MNGWMNEWITLHQPANNVGVFYSFLHIHVSVAHLVHKKENNNSLYKKFVPRHNKFFKWQTCTILLQGNSKIELEACKSGDSAKY